MALHKNKLLYFSVASTIDCTSLGCSLTNTGGSHLVRAGLFLSQPSPNPNPNQIKTIFGQNTTPPLPGTQPCLVWPKVLTFRLVNKTKVVYLY